MIQLVKGELGDQRSELEGEREEQYRLKTLQLVQQRSVENIQWQIFRLVHAC